MSKIIAIIFAIISAIGFFVSVFAPIDRPGVCQLGTLVFFVSMMISGYSLYLHVEKEIKNEKN